MFYFIYLLWAFVWWGDISPADFLNYTGPVFNLIHIDLGEISSLRATLNLVNIVFSKYTDVLMKSRIFFPKDVSFLRFIIKIMGIQILSVGLAQTMKNCRKLFSLVSEIINIH